MMTFALRFARLPVAITVRPESFLQYSCLGNALLRRRHYVTKESRDPLPPRNKEYKKEVVTNPNADMQSCSKHSEASTKTSSSPQTKSIEKMQQAASALQDGTMQPKDASQTKASTQQVRDNVRTYVFFRFLDHVKNYDKVLEKNFPSAMKIYRVFFDGVKEFYVDMKRFLKVIRIVNSSPEGIRSLNRQELELYVQMPRDMRKVAPALILSSLPLVGYAIFPLVVMFPRQLLTSHFWSLQQKSEFKQFYLVDRLSHNRAVFRSLQAKLKSTSKHPKHKAFSQLLGQIGSGTHPSVEQILDVKEIFEVQPYSLVKLPGRHITLLTKMHGLRPGLFKRHHLYEHAFTLHYMDLAINREGGVHNMPMEALRTACYIRGLNPVNLSTDEMVNWMRDWIKVSVAINAEQITLFLHLPLFMGYNHPNNWQLIYGKDKLKNPPVEE